MNYIIKISHKKDNDRTTLNLNEKYFSDVAPYFSKNKDKEFNRPSLRGTLREKETSKKGIFQNYSLNELLIIINNQSILYSSHPLKKDKCLALLKFLCKEGTSTKDAIKSSPFLFFDIDVKKEENSKLYNDVTLNNKIYEFMFSISVLCFRSSSGKGMAGILYVPELANEKYMTETKMHIEIGKKVNEYINTNLDIPCKIEFDNAQNKFRQLRYIPPQKNYDGTFREVKINPNYCEFVVNFNEVEEESIEFFKPINKEPIEYKKTTLSKSKNYSFAINNYNININCSTLLKKKYEYINGDNQASRYNRIGGDSKALIVYHETNTFHDFKGQITGSTPFDLLASLNFNGDKKTAYKYILEQGFNKMSKAYLKHHLCFSFQVFMRQEQGWSDEEINLEIDEYIESLLNPIEEELYSQEKEYMVRNHIENHGYLNSSYKLLYSNNNKIVTNLHLENNEYLKSDWLLKKLDKRINILRAGCGIGKTSSIFNSSNAIAKNKKVLFLVPRTIMVQQQAITFKGNFNIIASAGGNCKIQDKKVIYLESLSNNLHELFEKDKLSEIEITNDTILKKEINIKSNVDTFKNAIKSGIITYDQFQKIPLNILKLYDFICFDESHTILTDMSFRFDVNQKALDKVNQIIQNKENTKFVFLTATPNTEVEHFFKAYKNDVRLINVYKKHINYPKIHVIDTKEGKTKNLIFKRIIASITDGKKVIVLINSRDKASKFWKELETYCNKNSIIENPQRAFIESSNKEQAVFKEITESNSLGTINLLLTTSLLEVGVNIEIKEGIDFIFDYTNKISHTDANNALQLIYRNRNRNTNVFCYAKLFNENEVNKTVLGNRKSKALFKEKISSELFLKQIERDYQLKTTKVDNDFFISEEHISKFAFNLYKIYEESLFLEKQLSTFLQLCKLNGCSIYFDFEEIGENNPKEFVGCNDLVINVLSKLINIENKKDVTITPLNYEGSNSKTIHEDFEVISLKEEDEKIIIKANYHSLFNKLIQDIVFYHNYLRKFYFDNIANVLNFIFNNYKGKNLYRKIGNYISTHRCFNKENKKLLSLILEKTDNFEEEGISTGDIIFIKDNISTEIIESLKVDFRNNNLNIKEKVSPEVFISFTNDILKKHIWQKIDSILNVIFDISRENKIKIFKNKFIIESDYKSDLNQEEKHDDILQFLSMGDNFINENISHNLMKKYSNNNQDISLSSRKLRLDTKKNYSNENVTFNIKKNYFQNDYSQKKKAITESYIFNKYKINISDFKNLKENKRSKNFYIAVNLENDDFYIEKSKVKLFEGLKKNNILEKMDSNSPYDFSKESVFNKYHHLCKNYHIQKISI